MSLIKVTNLTFAYEGSFDNIFENVSFAIDTNWKLGFIGRNGKGKTTFLNLLLGKYEYTGSIATDTVFDYFPYSVAEKELEKTAYELMSIWKPGVESWRVLCEMPALQIDAELLYRPMKTLSFGERTKVMLAVLFSGENDFLLIDEPTNHLDKDARETIKRYLSGKKGFILVSHDRDLLDFCADHVLVLNRSSIAVENGNFTTWWENKEKADRFALAENEKHLREIGKLKEAADKTARWAEQNENTKIGFDPIKEHDRCLSSRSFIAAKTKKMQSRVKSYETRINREIEEKEGLLSDIESITDLKIMPLTHYKKLLVECRDFSLTYEGSSKPAVHNFSFSLEAGDILFINGENGCGKSSIIKAILAGAGYEAPDNFTTTGECSTASNLVISYINQDTSGLKGTLKEYAIKLNLDYSLFLSLLRQLDFERVQFEKKIEDFSEGQKKRCLSPPVSLHQRICISGTNP